MTVDEADIRADERARCVAAILQVEAALRDAHNDAQARPTTVAPIKTLGFFDGLNLARYTLQVGA